MKPLPAVCSEEVSTMRGLVTPRLVVTWRQRRQFVGPFLFSVLLVLVYGRRKLRTTVLWTSRLTKAK